MIDKSEIAPYEIVGGIPARTIQYRYSEEIVAELVKAVDFSQGPNKVRKQISSVKSDD